MLLTLKVMEGGDKARNVGGLSKLVKEADSPLKPPERNTDLPTLRIVAQ